MEILGPAFGNLLDLNQIWNLLDIKTTTIFIKNLSGLLHTYRSLTFAFFMTNLFYGLNIMSKAKPKFKSQMSNFI